MDRSCVSSIDRAWPVERTLLTGGILDHGIGNARGVVGPESPQLADISYSVSVDIPDTGVLLDPYQLRSH